MSRRANALAVIVLVLAAPTARAASLPPVRAWLEAGATFDREGSDLHDESGPAFAVGFEVGRRWGLLVTVGYEHYDGHVGPYQESFGSQYPPNMIVEGDTPMTAWIVSAGLRVSIPAGPLECSVDASLGGYNLFQHRPSYTDPATGAIVIPSETSSDGVPMGEFGLTLRTHRGQSFDGFFGVRFRGYSQVGEAGAAGSTAQARVGILSR